MPGSITGNEGSVDRCFIFRIYKDNTVMNLLKRLNRDEEIQEMLNFIYENTGKWPGLLFWNGETVEEYRERLRKRVNEIKETNN